MQKQGPSSILPGGEKIEHGGHAKHDTSRHSIPFQPECDEGGSD